MINYDELKNAYIDQSLEEMIGDMQWQDYSPSSLSQTIPAVQVKNQLKMILKNFFFNPKEEERLSRSVQIINKNLYRIPNEQLCRKELKNAAQKIYKDFKENLEKVTSGQTIHSSLLEELNQTNDESKTLSDVLHFSLPVCASFYEIGAKLYEEQGYEEAASVFQFLSLIDPYRHETWLSLGYCHQKLGEWFFAVSCYSLASLMKPEEIMPYLCSAECFLAVNDKENAKNSLLFAQHFLTPQNENLYLHKMTTLLNSLSK